MVNPTAQITELRNFVLDEIFKAIGVSEKGWMRRLLWPLFWLPAQRFAELGVRFDHQVAANGFRQAARWLLPQFIDEYSIDGGDNIPEKGPLLIASNHPGTVDSLLIGAQIPRNDFKFIAGDLPFVRGLSSVGRYMIHTTQDTHVRMTTLRSSIRHLEDGGALLIFPTGGIDPDPAFMPSAVESLDAWSRSLGLFLRTVPHTKVLIAIVSGILAPTFYNNPIPKLRKNIRDRQRIAEFMQVIRQLLIPSRLSLSPKISFSSIMSLDIAERDDVDNALQTIILESKKLYQDHIKRS